MAVVFTVKWARLMLRRVARHPGRGGWLTTTQARVAIRIVREALRHRHDDAPVSEYLADACCLLACRGAPHPPTCPRCRRDR